MWSLDPLFLIRHRQPTERERELDAAYNDGWNDAIEAARRTAKAFAINPRLDRQLALLNGGNHENFNIS